MCGDRPSYSRRMASLITELFQAWRSLLHRPSYLLTCGVTLTLVLGANAAIFAVVNTTMLRPMPFATSGEPLRLFAQPPSTSSAADRNPLQQMEVPRLRERLRTIARLEGFFPSERVILRNGEPDVAPAAAVTPGLLPMMAAPLTRGRWFTDDEGTPGHRVAIITDRFWRDTLGVAFKFAELMTDRGLRDVHPVGGARHAFGARNLGDHTEVARF